MEGPKIILCHTEGCCPEVFRRGKFIIITDDNSETERHVELTIEQFKALLEKGKEILK